MSSDARTILMAYMCHYARTGACFNKFKTWTRELFEDLIARGTKDLAKVTLNDLIKVPLKDLEELGFRAWNENSSLLLIPIYFVDALDQNEVVTDIDGNTSRIHQIDLDVRYGLVAYGFHHPELQTKED